MDLLDLQPVQGDAEIFLLPSAWLLGFLALGTPAKTLPFIIILL